MNIYDIGENDLISVDFNLEGNPNGEYIINIISQELRYEKKINHYTPKIFINLIPEEIEFENEQEFNIDNYNSLFTIPLQKKSEKNEMLLLNYNLEEQSPIDVEITGPSGNSKLFNIYNSEGFLNFLYNISGSYKIFFTKSKNELLSEDNKEVKGIFKIISTESAFDLDISKDKIEFNEFNLSRDDIPSLKFNIHSLDKDYTKKISISNIDLNNLNSIFSINKNNEGFKNLNFNYYTFEKNAKYTVKINFNKKKEKEYTLEKVKIIDFSPNNIQPIAQGNIIYNDDKFLIINWKNLYKIEISNNNTVKLFISELTESQSNNLVREFQNIKFIILNNTTIEKSSNSEYSVLFLEVTEPGAELYIKYIERPKKINNKNNILTIVLISIGGFIALIFLVCIILRCIKKRKEIDFTKKAQEIQEEKLLNEL